MGRVAAQGGVGRGLRRRLERRGLDIADMEDLEAARTGDRASGLALLHREHDGLGGPHDWILVEERDLEAVTVLAKSTVVLAAT